MTRSTTTLAIVALAILCCCACAVEAKRHHHATTAVAPLHQAAASWLFEASAVPQGVATQRSASSSVKQINWTLYKQCGESWSDETLGTQAGETICDAGCAMSSVSMVLKTKGTDVNPGTLNSWLNGHGGYADRDLLVWGSVEAFGTVKLIDYYRGAGSLSQEGLQDFINKGYGVVVNVRNGGHWVLVTAHADGSNYAVNDPGFEVYEYAYGDMSNYVVYG